MHKSGSLPHRRSAGRASASPGALGTALAVLLLAACSPQVKVEPPDKPIEINVNVKIEHEVRVKLDRAVESTLEENPELFGLEAGKK